MERSVILVLTAIILTISCLILRSNGIAHHPPCLGVKVNYTELEYIALGECVLEYAPPSKDTNGTGTTESTTIIRARIELAKTHKCFEPCFMNIKKMFKDGKINIPTCETFIDRYPEEAVPKLKKALAKCAKPIEDTELKMDKNCTEYATYLKCYKDEEDKICKRKQ